MNNEDKPITLTLGELKAVIRKCCVCDKLGLWRGYDDFMCDDHGKGETEINDASTIRSVQARIDKISQNPTTNGTVTRLVEFHSELQNDGPNYVFELVGKNILFAQENKEGLVYDRWCVALCDVDAFIDALREARDKAING